MINNLKSLTNVLNTGILEMIEAHSYYAYILNRDNEIKCSCMIHETKQPDPTCERCLGTGNKIKITKIKLASQDTKLPPTFRSDGFIVARNYFLPSKHTILENDYIIDKNEVYLAFEIQNLISLEGTIPYQKVSSSKKKFDTKIFISNFYKLLKIKNYENIHKPPILPSQPIVPTYDTDLIVVAKDGREIMYDSVIKE